VTTTDQTILVANDEYDFFGFIFTSNLVDLGQALREVAVRQYS